MGSNLCDCERRKIKIIPLNMFYHYHCSENEYMNEVMISINVSFALFVVQLGRYTVDRTRLMVDTTTLKIAKETHRPPIPDDGYV